MHAEACWWAVLLGGNQVFQHPSYLPLSFLLAPDFLAPDRGGHSHEAWQRAEVAMTFVPLHLLTLPT